MRTDAYTALMARQHIRIQIGGPGGSGQGPGKPPGLLARIFFSIIAVILLVSAAFLGAMFFLAALGVFFFVSIVVVVRVWWARRQIEAAMRRGEMPGLQPGQRRGERPGERPGERAGAQPGQKRPGQESRSTVIDGEYRVMREERDGQGGRDREGQ